MGLLNTLNRLFFDLAVIILLLIFIPGIPPKTSFTSYEVAPTKPLTGGLALNSILDEGERLFEGKINGPESIASRRIGEIFVGLHGGKILRIFGKNYDHTKFITSIGPGCDGPWDEEVCGRPLGLRFDVNGKLIVADGYLGIFSVDVETGEKEMLVDGTEAIDGKVPLLIDDIDFDRDGNIFFSDASTISNLNNAILELFSDPTGRLLKYDIETKKTSVVVDNLHFANGVQMSPDKSFVLVSETFRYRILRFWLTGPKAGQSDVFIDGLPGMPDNLRALKTGGYYVSLIVTKQTAKPHVMMESLRTIPLVRKLISRLLLTTRYIFDYATKIYPNDYTKKISFNILNLAPIATLLGCNHTIIVELDANGGIVSSLQGVTGKISGISETVKVGNNLFFGSPYNKYLGRLKLALDPSQNEDLDKEILEETSGVKITQLGEDRLRIRFNSGGEEKSDQTTTPPKASEPSPTAKPSGPEPTDTPPAKASIPEPTETPPAKASIPKPTETPPAKASIPQPTETPPAKASVSKPTETPPAKASVAEPTVERPAAKASVPEPTVETPAAKASVPKPKVETPAAKASVPEPTVETPAAKASVPEPIVETPQPKVIEQPTQKPEEQSKVKEEL